MKVGFIGGGKMGTAMIADLVRTQTVDADDIYVREIDEERARLLKQRHGVNLSAGYAPLLHAVEVVFLAVKPQSLDALLGEIQNLVTSQHLLISIAAGKRTGHIESLLPTARVLRVMPNLAALVSESMTVFCAGNRVTVEDRRRVNTLLSSFGQVLELPESQFDAVTALSGSGPAFLAFFLQAMIDAGIQLGLAERDAGLLAKQTLLGTAKLLVKGEFETGNLIKAVSSPGGTTVAGFEILQPSPVKEVISRTLAAAARRSEELSR